MNHAKSLLAASILASAVLAPAAAFGDDKAACVDASFQAQQLRRDHRLLEARDQLRICAAAACPGAVQGDCATWLGEVEKTLPSVVPSAKNGAGADLIEVKVSVDGKPLVSKLDGQAQAMNPGAHTFHFETADGTSADQQVVVREGEKNQPVAVVLGAPSTPITPGAGADHAADATPSSSSTWKTVGWVLGGLGIVGVGVGTAFGIAASISKSSDCTGSVCKDGTLGGIKGQALASDVGLIAGGVLIASGVALVLFTPGGGHEAPAPAGTLRLAPALLAGGGGAVVGGRW